ncbi:hypothetical protein ON010_g7135 [Phytophthora cinnamomi]|nr:hypothetical protein ON010_g7135 [Phytophthora cinnamomi]
MRARNNAFKPKSPAQRRREMAKFKEIQPYELVNFIGLLCGRAMCPHRGNLSRHWAANAHGAVAKGTFGKYMARHRFEEIVRYLHFSSNDDPDARRVKTWKIKPVEDAINNSFSRGMTVGPRIAFDEGMIPMRSRFNPMRQYLKAKPHLWGTKCHLTCDSATGYCYRAEIYQGREQSDRGNGIDLSLQTAFTQVFSTPRCFLTVGSSTLGPFVRIVWASARVLSTKRKSPEATGDLIGLHSRAYYRIWLRSRGWMINQSTSSQQDAQPPLQQWGGAMARVLSKFRPPTGSRLQ